MRKKLLSILALLCLTVSGAWADVLYSGPCGTSGHENDVRWSLTDNGTFTVYGSGAMADYTDPDDRPWSVRTESITSVVINEGVTRIGNKAFLNCSNLTTVTIYASPCILGDGVFTSCGNLTHIYVFSDLVDDFKKASDWSSYTGIISAIPDVTAHEGATGQYWATYYNELADVQMPEGTQVFKVHLDDLELTLTKIEDGIVNRGEGVVLKSNSASITLASAASPSKYSYEGNSLLGTMTKITTTKGDDFYYVLHKESAGVGFYKLSDDGGIIDANKAYLVDGGGIGEPNAREFFLFDEATGIVELKNSRIEELKSDDAWYTLDGRKLEGRLQGKKATTKGLYIVGGKKVVIK